MARFGEYELDNYRVYVLALEKGKFYVGVTKEVQRRFAEHKSGKGSAFTRKYSPLGIVYQKNIKTKIKKVAESEENAFTINLMKKYGIENVRGGHYCQISTADVINTMGVNLSKEIEEAFRSGKNKNTFKKIDKEVEALSAREKGEPVNIANDKKKNSKTRIRKKNKKEVYWWDTWKKENP